MNQFLKFLESIKAVAPIHNSQFIILSEPATLFEDEQHYHRYYYHKENG